MSRRGAGVGAGDGRAGESVRDGRPGLHGETARLQEDGRRLPSLPRTTALRESRDHHPRLQLQRRVPFDRQR